MGNNQDANGIIDEVKNKIVASAEQMQQHASDTKKKGSDETIGVESQIKCIGSLMKHIAVVVVK